MSDKGQSSEACYLDTSKIQEISASICKKYTYDEIVKITNNFSELLGKGGFAEVYKGYLVLTSVAVKTFEMEAQKHFLGELKNSLKIIHPNVISIYGVCTDTKYCIIMEYMSQGTLQDYIDKKKGCIELSKERILEVLIELNIALQYLHNNNFFHRDIKPDNILFDSYGRPKFGDFNISSFYEEDKSSYTATRWAGTELYMDIATLQVGGVGYCLDMYSIGMTMLVLLCQKENKNVLFRDGEKIYLKNDVKALREFFVEDWGDQVAMKLLKCAMECTKDDYRTRPKALELAEMLGNILDMLKTGCKEIKTTKEYENKFIYVDFHIDEEKNKIDLILTLNPRYNIEKCYVLHMYEQYDYYELCAIMCEKKETSDFSSIEEIEEGKNICTCNDIEFLLIAFSEINRVCSKIILHNISEIHIKDSLTINTDIKIESDTKTCLKIDENKEIIINGEDIKVEFVNLIFKDITVSEHMHPIINVEKAGKLIINNCIFENNKMFPFCSIIKGNYKLELIKTKFEDNESTDGKIIDVKGQIYINECIFKPKLLTQSSSSFKPHSIRLEIYGEEENFNITNSYFIDCHLLIYCGKVKGNIYNCTFKQTNNYINERDQSDILLFIKVEGNDEINIEKSNFLNCSSLFNNDNSTVGDGSKINIKSCKYEENISDMTHGSTFPKICVKNYFWAGNSLILTVQECKFNVYHKNKNKDKYNGDIVILTLNKVKANIKDSEFNIKDVFQTNEDKIYCIWSLHESAIEQSGNEFMRGGVKVEEEGNIFIEYPDK